MDLAIMAQKGIPSSEFIDDVSWNVWMTPYVTQSRKELWKCDSLLFST
jgi:hypothetical protein